MEIHHHSHRADSLNGVYVTAIILNLAFVIAEACVGLWSGSLGLISDAGHNLGDVFALMLAMLAFRLSMTHGSKRFTYGYRKASVLISLLNAIILIAAVVVIVMESVRKFYSPAYVDGVAVSWTAVAGIFVNGITAFMLMKRQKHDINTKGAFLHMAADTLVSAGVALSGVVIVFTGWTLADPIISILIAAVILASTWKLLSESFRMSIDAVPQNIDVDKIISVMCAQTGVADVHHIHIWAVSTTEVALTAHVVISDLGDMEQVKASLKKALIENGISHSTLEIEGFSSTCQDMTMCDFS